MASKSEVSVRSHRFPMGHLQAFHGRWQLIKQRRSSFHDSSSIAGSIQQRAVPSSCFLIIWSIHSTCVQRKGSCEHSCRAFLHGWHPGLKGFGRVLEGNALRFPAWIIQIKIGQEGKKIKERTVQKKLGSEESQLSLLSSRS